MKMTDFPKIEITRRDCVKEIRNERLELEAEIKWREYQAAGIFPEGFVPWHFALDEIPGYEFYVNTCDEDRNFTAIGHEK